MKTKLFAFILISISYFSFSQNTVQIKVFTDTKIIGVGTPNATLHIKPASNTAEITKTVAADGKIDFDLTGLTSGIDAVIWQTVNSVDSEKIVRPIISAVDMVKLLTDPNATGENALKNHTISEKLMSNDLLMKSTVASYRRTILNTNFTIPVARFDINKPKYDANGDLIGDSKGSISLFSSFGFGVGICGGRAEVTRDSSGTVIDESFSNTFGVYLGILYQASTGENPRNVFAPTLSLSILDIQVGVGYDYGKVPTNQERTFVTVSYGIPLFKLFKTNHRVWLDENKTPFAVKKI